MFAELASMVRFQENGPAERLLYETQDFRVMLLGIRPGQETPLRATTSSVLFYVVAGSGRIQVGEQVQEVSAGAVAICPPYEPYRVVGGPSPMTLLVVAAPSP